VQTTAIRRPNFNGTFHSNVSDIMQSVLPTRQQMWELWEIQVGTFIVYLNMAAYTEFLDECALSVLHSWRSHEYDKRNITRYKTVTIRVCAWSEQTVQHKCPVLWFILQSRLSNITLQFCGVSHRADCPVLWCILQSRLSNISVQFCGVSYKADREPNFTIQHLSAENRTNWTLLRKWQCGDIFP
jgi:hypothetical protein